MVRVEYIREALQHLAAENLSGPNVHPHRESDGSQKKERKLQKKHLLLRRISNRLIMSAVASFVGKIFLDDVTESWQKCMRKGGML